MRRWLGQSVAAIGVAAILGGCATVPDVPNPVAITAGEYERVFDASVEVLREMQFIVDRRDRRFGVVTTHPLIASSVVEPWHRDNTTPYQVAESTLNMQRRLVRIEISPEAGGAEMAAGPSDAAPPEAAPRIEELAAALDAAGQATPPQPPIAVGTEPGSGLRLAVQVMIERRYHPPRDLSTAALSERRSRRRLHEYRPLLTEHGEIVSRWEPMRRDEHLERRLIAAILNRAVANPNPAAAAAAEPQPAPPVTPIESAAGG